MTEAKRRRFPQIAGATAALAALNTGIARAAAIPAARTSGTLAYSRGTYELTVTGPNGFLRGFRGPGTTAGPEVTARHDAFSGDLVLTLTNQSATDVRLTVSQAAAYGGRSPALRRRRPPLRRP
ncbi:phospholipase domain-containing protein [Streptomyces sp. NBC_01216]|uniref:phospholipase domain-containing protein n=1 Tax=Streptomyces sp. NBC_01216 TaxID=2903778 RepID=UPI003FA3AE8A